MAERRQWTEEDLAALRQAAETLERLGVWSVSVRGACHRRTMMHVDYRDLGSIAQLPGVTMTRPEYQGPNSWIVTAYAGDIGVHARLDTAELPIVGWRLVGPEPQVERLEEVTP